MLAMAATALLFSLQAATSRADSASNAKAINDIIAEGERLRFLMPFAYNNPEKRKQTYKDNVEKAKSVARDYKSKADAQLKDPFKTSFLFFISGLASFPIMNDIRESDDQVGSRSIAELETLLSSVFDRTLKTQAAFASLSLDPQPTDQNTIPAPDPRIDIRVSGTIKMADGKPALGATFVEKSRNYVSEAFERTVRIFIAGSDQLARDTNAPWTGKNKILGMYDGFTPRIISSISEDKIAPGSFYPGWINGGIANLMNGTFKYFKFPNNRYEAETPSKNHHIENGSGGSASSFSRGEMVNTLMMVMKKMQTDLKTKGKIIEAGAYGVLDSCANLRAEILPYRDLIKGEYDAFYSGQKKQKTFTEVEQCGQVDAAKIGDNANSPQMRTCRIAAMQNTVELNLITQYMFCTWRAVAEEIIQRSESSLSTQNENTPKPNEPNWVAKAENWIRNLELIPNSFAQDGGMSVGAGAAAGGATGGATVVAGEAGPTGGGRTSLSNNAGRQSGDAWDSSTSRALGADNSALGQVAGALGSVMGLVGQFLGPIFNSVGIGHIRSSYPAGYGAVACSNGVGSFTTGSFYPPLLMTFVIPDQKREETLVAMARAAVAAKSVTHFATEAAAKAALKDYSYCRLYCYADEITVMMDSSKQTKYNEAMAACGSKLYLAHMFSAPEMMKDSCSCRATFPPDTAPPGALAAGMAANLNNSRDLSGNQLGAGAEDGAPPASNNVIAEELPTMDAATAGQVETVKKAALPEGPKTEAMMGNAAAANKASEGEVKNSGTEFKLGSVHTDVLSNRDMTYNLNPNNSDVYNGGSKTPNKNGNDKGLAAGGKRNEVDPEHAEGGTENSAFGAAGADESNAMLSADPEDYFSRIKMADDIFKAVSRRYYTQATHWFNDELGTSAKH